LLSDVLGLDAGANFHTWAVWGSREAGTTITRRDLPGLRGIVGAVVALLGGALGVLLGDLRLAALLGLVFGVFGAWLVDVELQKARNHISHGNRIVLEEIGGVTLRFVAAWGDRTRADQSARSEFFDRLIPGPTTAGGQDLLRDAFSAYDLASRETDRDRRHQLVFAANSFAVWHEHIRLQRDIAGAMPRFLRGAVTRALLDFRVGPEHLHVGRDLTPVHGAVWPTTLTRLSEQMALHAVDGLRFAGRSRDDLAGSAASSWAVRDQRMNYVVDLFRSRHLEPGVFDDPYPDAFSTTDR
jgi:hypothetical protein